MYDYLCDNGMTRDEYHWFLEYHIKPHCVMGNDYYATNERIVHADGTTIVSGEIFGYEEITRHFYERYRLPLMHTETNTTEPGAVDWLFKEWAQLRQLKREGVPIIGFTWYGLVDQVDWDTALREDNGHVNPLGLYDLQRKIRPVGKAYQRLVQQWKDVLPTESTCLTLAAEPGPDPRPKQPAGNLNREVTPRPGDTCPLAQISPVVRAMLLHAGATINMLTLTVAMNRHALLVVLLSCRTAVRFARCAWPHTLCCVPPLIVAEDTYQGAP